MKVTNYSIERLDHLGIIEKIDKRLGIYPDESLSAGKTVAGMIINGLGFSNKPLSNSTR